MSEASQDFQAIVCHFLNSRKQWQAVPQIVFLTVKAMSQNCQYLQQKIACHQQLLTQLSVRMRTLDEQFNKLRNNNNDISEYEEIPIYKDTGFNKNKSINHKYTGSKAKQARSQSNKKSRLNQNQSNLKSSYRSMNSDRFIDQMVVQQIKNLTQTVINQKINDLNKKLNQNYINLKQQFNQKIQGLQKQNLKQPQKLAQNINLSLDGKTRQMEKQLLNKIHVQRTSLIKFVQQNALQTQKLWGEITSLYNRVNQIVQQNKLPYSNPIHLRGENDGKQKSRKSPEQIHEHQNNEQKPKNQSKILELFNGLNNQFKQFKLKTMKQNTQLIKFQQVQIIISKHQKQVNDKISKISTNVSNLQKLFQSAKRQNLKRNQSKGSLLINKQQKSKIKKQKSEQSLRSIQESLQKLENYFKQKIRSLKKQFSAQIDKKFEQQHQQFKSQMREQMQYRQKNMCDIVQTNCDKLVKYKQQNNLGSDFNLLKNKSIQKLFEQMVLSRYLHFGERQSREFIEWQKNVYTTLQQNFAWRNGSSVVQIIAPGLYRLQAGLYPDNQSDRISAFVVLNGQPISQLKNKQVPLNSKAVARGSIFNQAVLLPAKSKISIKVQLPFFGQAYMQIHKL